MHDWAVGLRDFNGGVLKRADLSLIEAGENCWKWYANYRHLLEPYVELVVKMVDFIARSDRADKMFYMDLLRVTLSPGELFVLFHHGLATDERTSFRRIAGEYGFFEGFDPEMYQIQGNRRLWYGARKALRQSA